MILNFIAPLDQAHLEILFAFPVASVTVPSVSVNLTGSGVAQVTTVYLGGFAGVNGTLTYSGRVILVSSTPATKLQTLISSAVAVNLSGIDAPGPVIVKAFAQTSKRELTSLAVTPVA